MESFGRNHCKRQMGLRSCHNNIQKDLYRETAEQQGAVGRKLERVDRKSTRKITRG